jgi:hypothetical protein
MSAKSISNHRLFSLILILILSLTVLSWGQLSIVSTTPANGTANVDTVATFTLTFNTALDTSARFPFPGNFFLNILLSPDSLVGEPDSIFVSPDLKTVTIQNLHLEQNTTYYFVIVNAVSQAGDSLDIPYGISFSTKPVLPTANVSGTLSYPGNDPTGALLILFDRNPFA